MHGIFPARVLEWVPSPSPVSKLVATLLDNIGRPNKLQETYCQDTDGPSRLTHQSHYCLESWNDLNLLGQQETYTYLMLSILLDRFPKDTLSKMIDEAFENDRISDRKSVV